MNVVLLMLVCFGLLVLHIATKPKTRSSIPTPQSIGGVTTDAAVNASILAQKNADKQAEADKRRHEEEMARLRIQEEAARQEAARQEAARLEAEDAARRKREMLGPPFEQTNGMIGQYEVGHIYTIRLADAQGNHLNGGPHLFCTTHEARLGLGKYQVGVSLEAGSVDSSKSSVKNQWHLKWHQGFVRIGARNAVPNHELGTHDGLCLHAAGEGPLHVQLATNHHQHYWELGPAGNYGTRRFQIYFACNFHNGGCDTDYGLVAVGNQVYLRRGRSQASWWTRG